MVSTEKQQLKRLLKKMNRWAMKQYQLFSLIIYCDFRYLAHPSIGQIIFAGPRRYDQLLRAKMAGIDESKIKLVQEPEKAAQALDIKNCGDVFLLYEMYRTKDSAVTKKELIQMMEGDAANEN